MYAVNLLGSQRLIKEDNDLAFVTYFIDKKIYVIKKKD